MFKKRIAGLLAFRSGNIIFATRATFTPSSCTYACIYLYYKYRYRYLYTTILNNKKKFGPKLRLEAGQICFCNQNPILRTKFKFHHSIQMLFPLFSKAFAVFSSIFPSFSHSFSNFISVLHFLRFSHFCSLFQQIFAVVFSIFPSFSHSFSNFIGVLKLLLLTKAFIFLGFYHHSTSLQVLSQKNFKVNFPRFLRTVVFSLLG